MATNGVDNGDSVAKGADNIVSLVLYFTIQAALKSSKKIKCGVVFDITSKINSYVGTCGA